MIFISTTIFAQYLDPQELIINKKNTVPEAFEDCMFKGQKMDCVKVRILPKWSGTSGKHFKVRIVDDNEDLTVKILTGNSWSSGSCGQWWFVKSGEDFAITFVEYGEDFTIRINEKN